MEGAARAEYLAQVESMLTPVEIMPFDFFFHPFKTCLILFACIIHQNSIGKCEVL